MATKAAHKRLTREYKLIQESPAPFIQAQPAETDILEWHYIITGPPDTPYEGGQYHGTLVFPSEYPFKPPAIRMCTPSGRFSVNTRLCLSMSDYHPKSWNPTWSVSTILTGLLSFMVTEEHTTGSIMSTEAQRRALARRSYAYNAANPRFREVFGDLNAKDPLAVVPTKSEQASEQTQEPKKKREEPRPKVAAAQIKPVARQSSQWVVVTGVAVLAAGYLFSKVFSTAAQV